MRYSSEHVVLIVSRDGWTQGHQLSIHTESGGFRLCGPKINGSSTVILKYHLDRAGIRELRAACDAAESELSSPSPAGGGDE